MATAAQEGRGHRFRDNDVRLKAGRAFFFCVDVEVALVCRARAIGYRQHNREAVGGFFSQIGNLYMVHHLWGTVRSQRLIQA